MRSVARLDATKTSLIKALSSNETATNWGVSTSSPEVIVYRRKILQALQQGDQVSETLHGSHRVVVPARWNVRACATAVDAVPTRRLLRENG